MWLITLYVLINQIGTVEPKRYCQPLTAWKSLEAKISLRIHFFLLLFCFVRLLEQFRFGAISTVPVHWHLYRTWIRTRRKCIDGISVYTLIRHNKCVELTEVTSERREYNETSVLIQFTSAVTDYEFVLSFFPVLLFVSIASSVNRRYEVIDFPRNVFTDIVHTIAVYCVVVLCSLFLCEQWFYRFSLFKCTLCKGASARIAFRRSTE